MDRFSPLSGTSGRDYLVRRTTIPRSSGRRLYAVWRSYRFIGSVCGGTHQLTRAIGKPAVETDLERAFLNGRVTVPPPTSRCRLTFSLVAAKIGGRIETDRPRDPPTRSMINRQIIFGESRERRSCFKLQIIFGLG